MKHQALMSFQKLVEKINALNVVVLTQWLIMYNITLLNQRINP